MCVCVFQTRLPVSKDALGMNIVTVNEKGITNNSNEPLILHDKRIFPLRMNDSSVGSLNSGRARR